MSSQRKSIAFGVTVVALIVCVFVFNLPARLSQALDWIESLGILAPVVFIAIYSLATVLFIPGSVLTIGAGVVFGAVWGTVWVTLAANLGAFLAFITGRYFARDWVQSKIEGNRYFRAIDEAVAQESWKVVGLVRLSPVMPFNLVNYAFGLTKVKLAPYVIMSIIGMIPGTILYVYIGSLARGQAMGKTTGEWIFTLVGLIATVTVTVFITRAARRQLNDMIPEEEGSKA
ncbi:MAG: TVP38/TMEM64 family protein [Verrucomicrobiota bacterium]